MFTHGEVSKNFFAKISHRLAGIRRTRQNPRKCSKTPVMSKPPLCCRPKKFFQKIFPKKSEPTTAIILHPAEIFPKIFFQKNSKKNSIHGRLRRKCAISKDAFMLDREKFFPNFFSKIFGLLRRPADSFVRET
jgi:hypothetical protein